MNRAILRDISVNTCDMCVILSAMGVRNMTDPYLVDKEVILCSLNIKAMQFDYGNGLLLRVHKSLGYYSSVVIFEYVTLILDFSEKE